MEQVLSDAEVNRMFSRPGRQWQDGDPAGTPVWWLTEMGREELREAFCDKEWSIPFVLLTALEDLEFRSGLKAQFMEAY